MHDYFTMIEQQMLLTLFKLALSYQVAVHAAVLPFQHHRSPFGLLGLNSNF